MFPFSIPISIKTSQDEKQVYQSLVRALGSAKRVKKRKEGFYELEPEINFASSNLIPDIRAYYKLGRVVLNYQNPYGFFAMVLLSGMLLYSVLKDFDDIEWTWLLFYAAAWIVIPSIFNLLSMAVSVFASAAIREELRKTNP